MATVAAAEAVGSAKAAREAVEREAEAKVVEEMVGAGWVVVVMAAAMHVEMRFAVVSSVGAEAEVVRGGRQQRGSRRWRGRREKAEA